MKWFGACIVACVAIAATAYFSGIFTAYEGERGVQVQAAGDPPQGPPTTNLNDPNDPEGPVPTNLNDFDG